MRKMTGQLNAETGNPEIVENGVVIARSFNYRSPCVLFTRDGKSGYMVLSPYFEGMFPPELIGKLIKIDGR